MNNASNLYLYKREGGYLPRVAAVHDLCGYGKCSLGVAIPVLSAAGIDVCPVHTSLFSAHTRFPKFYMHDTTPMLDGYLDGWRDAGIELDGVYSGFLGSAEQVDAILRLYREYPNALRLVDPVMGDGGSKYPTYTDEMCEATKSLVDGADVLTPNLTEASIITGIPYESQDVDEAYVRRMTDALLGMGAKSVVLKGIVHEGESIIRNYVAVAEGDGTPEEVSGELLPYMLHGTGDLFASVCVGYLTLGRSTAEAIRRASEYVVRTLRVTAQNPDARWYGVDFETTLPLLWEKEEA